MRYEKYTSTMKPLGLESIVANSILDYVIDHPDEREPLSAYNDWVPTAIKRFFPIDEPSMAMFALKQFETYILKCSRESLLMCQEIEAEMADIEARELSRQMEQHKE